MINIRNRELSAWSEVSVAQTQGWDELRGCAWFLNPLALFTVKIKKEFRLLVHDSCKADYNEILYNCHIQPFSNYGQKFHNRMQPQRKPWAFGTRGRALFLTLFTY